jgi:mannose-6-phosphate isomerase-like protein (cupin superfamily)
MNNTDDYLFLTRSVQTNYSYFEFQLVIYAHGLCGDTRKPHLQRPCTPPLHVHLDQTEFFTVRKGRIGYQIGDQIQSCDVNTCPSPIVVPSNVPHTFWLDDNKEDLEVIIRLEPIMKNRGMREAFFENWAGVSRDQHTSIFQLFLLLNNARTYPALSPLILSKILVKTVSLIGQLLGYQTEYEEYTTSQPFEQLTT